MSLTISSPAGYAIEPIDLTGAGEDRVRPFVELIWAANAEEVPEDPPRPFQAVAARMTQTSTLMERWRWAAWTDQGGLAAALVMVRSLHDNQHIRDIGLNVHPAHRRHGLGTALLARAIEQIGGGEGVLLQAWTHSRVPAGTAFAEHLGAKTGLRARASQLDLAAIDRSLMAEWSAIDPAGYHLEWVLGRIPDELMDNALEAIRTMNTMPREDLQVEDFTVTVETLREWERMSIERGQEREMVLAIEDATGKTAGFTEIFFDRRVPEVLFQAGTAVVPSHRGKGIGKWVKARMIERVLAEKPEARYIRTENAGSNAPMLSINVRMGFKPAWEEVIWQLPLPAAREALSRAR